MSMYFERTWSNLLSLLWVRLMTHALPKGHIVIDSEFSMIDEIWLVCDGRLVDKKPVNFRLNLGDTIVFTYEVHGSLKEFRDAHTMPPKLD